jgi:cytochrome d ubiquinol oxidase subunit II
VGSFWFCLVAGMLAAYVILDGYDIGTGILHLFVARTDAERRLTLRSIGPLWDGNEVWLIAAGGTLYFAFPTLYAVSFSGFYLPLMMVLWLLVLRGISIELRNHVGGPVWSPFWDGVFSFASILLAIFFGAALGNVVRGVPMDAQGRFFEPLWTDFRPGTSPGILDWYTVSVALTAFAALAMHGALWITYKTEGDLRARARKIANGAWLLTLLLTAAITVFSLRLQPQIARNLASHPWGYMVPAAAVAGLLAVNRLHAARREALAFGASSLFLAGMIASAAFGIYPNVLPVVTDPARALTVANAAAPEFGLRVGMIWWTVGMALGVAYTLFMHRRFAGKVTSDAEGY